VGELAGLFEAMHGAPESFRTLRATLRHWSHEERARRARQRFNDEQAKRQSGGGTVSSIAFAYAGGGELPETLEWRSQLMIERPDRLRFEVEGEHAQLRIRNGERMWQELGEYGPIEQEVSIDELVDEQPELFAPLALVPAYDLELTGETSVAGRACRSLRGIPRESGPPHVGIGALGADEIELAVDDERGVVLRFVARFEGEPYQLVEVEQIAFDEQLDPALFVYEPPPGVRIRRPEELHSGFVHGLTLEEAVERVSFPLFAPSSVPEGTHLIVNYMPARERPELEEQVSLHYVGGDPARSFMLVERGANGSETAFPSAHVRVVREGTTIDLTSQELDEQELRAIAGALVPARREPPRLAP
jgi:outer membrane lipoprotein-sorting protein